MITLFHQTYAKKDQWIFFGPQDICKLLTGSRVIALILLFAPLFIQAVDSPNIKKIDINSAPLEDLVKIIHIGEVRAKELISLRPFSSLDDLTRIKGISKARVEDIKKQGLAYVKTEEKIETGKGIENDLKEKGNNEKIEEKKKLAAIGEQTPEKPSLLPLFIALPIAIFSGIIILTLKRKLKNLDLSGKIE
jgi:hypothetical protein